MDDQKKEQFRWKFYSLALMLNGTILFAACAAIAYFLAPASLKLPLVAILLILAIVLGLFFRRSYFRTKQWLEENSDPKGKDPASYDGDAGKEIKEE